VSVCVCVCVCADVVGGWVGGVRWVGWGGVGWGVDMRRARGGGQGGVVCRHLCL